jgi:methanogenic corrinoid protein MtbC1
MTTIADLPNEPKYTIKAVCARTGMRAVTLRAWERRYDLLTPFRSDNRYRLYSERDVGILRWVKSRVDSGLSISSAVAELRGMRKSSRWPEPVPSIEPITPRKGAHPPAQFATDLYTALVAQDEAATDGVLREVYAVFDVTTVCLEIITPALVEIGEAWHRGDIRIATEHFASNYLKGKVIALLQAYPNRRNAPFIMVGCAPTEQHEIGGLMVSVLLRREGYRVEYLGQDVPIEDLVDYAHYEHPAMICLAATIEHSALEMTRVQERLGKVCPETVFGYGGRAFNINPALRSRVPGNFLGETIDIAIANIRSLLS